MLEVAAGLPEERANVLEHLARLGRRIPHADQLPVGTVAVPGHLPGEEDEPGRALDHDAVRERPGMRRLLRERGALHPTLRYTSQPPSTVRHCPVMLRDSSVQRNSTAFATSSAVVTRRRAISCTYSS